MTDAAPEGLPLDAHDMIAVVRSHAHGEYVTAPQRRLGEVLRTLARHGLDPALDDDARDALAARLETIVADLPPPGATRYSPAERAAFFETGAPLINLRGGHPLFGQGTAVAVPLEIEVLPRHLTARFAFDSRQEGVPGWAHGGYVAALFDYVLGQAATASGASGPTGTLTVRYAAPTPIGTPLATDAWVAERAGRKIFVHGRLVDEVADVVCATAEAVFIGGAW